MSIDNIQLSPLTVGEWYKDALLASPDGSPAIQRPVQAPSVPTVQAPSVPTVQAPSVPTVQAPPSTTVPPPVRPAQPVAEAAPIAKAPLAQPPIADKPEPPASPRYKFLGNNRRQIAIVVHAPGSTFLPDNQLSFLTKILEACRMNIGDVAIVNAAATPVAVAELRQQLKPSSILLFGLEPVAIRLPINFPVFRLQPYDDCTYLSAPPLSQLVQNSEESKLLKSKLWVCLKTLFNV